jgi:acyl-coenzyme A thioesterase PaaI-like protein
VTPQGLPARRDGHPVMREANPNGDFRLGLFPLTPQLSVNLIRNANRGTLVAGAEIVHRGRTTLVVDVRVSDEHRRLIKLTATLLAPAAPVATASADLAGR